MSRLAGPQHSSMSSQEKEKEEKKEEKKEERTAQKKKTPKPRQGNGLADVAGMEELKQMIGDNLIKVIRNKEKAAAYGITPPSILFYGPAGCGKSFFSEKIAEELGINYMKIVPDDLACTWIHGTQQKIAEVFKEAEKKAPVLMFLDEFDAMVPARSNNANAQSYNGEVNEFLCMLNNASARGIYVLAATNHPECIDKAILRTGRIDELIYIDMPDDAARQSLFALALGKLPSDENINIGKLAELTKGYSCSDITYIIQAASRKVFNESLECEDDDLRNISQQDIEEIIAKKQPSVSAKDLVEFERLRAEFSPKDKQQRKQHIGFA